MSYFDEEWKPVVGLEEWFQISSYGRLRRIKAGKRGMVGLVRAPNCSDTYAKHFMLINGKLVIQRAHVMVALAFLGPKPTPLHEVAHRDHNKHNPHIANLRWATRSDNANDRWCHGTMREGEKSNLAKLTALQVIAIRQLYTLGLTQGTIAKQFDVCRSQIGRIVTRVDWAWLD